MHLISVKEKINTCTNPAGEKEKADYDERCIYQGDSKCRDNVVSYIKVYFEK